MEQINLPDQGRFTKVQRAAFGRHNFPPIHLLQKGYFPRAAFYEVMTLI